MTIRWELMLHYIKKANFCTHSFSLKKCTKYGLDPVPDFDHELDPESETESKLFQCRNRSRTLLRFHNTKSQESGQVGALLNPCRFSLTSERPKETT
jgi:hypothetical protein